MSKVLETSRIFCVFSEDVRPEQSGQTTVIGWYNNGFVAMPKEGALRLRRMSINCVIEVPKLTALNKLVFEIMMNEKVLNKISLPNEALASLLNSMGNPEQQANRAMMGLQFAVQLSPLVVTEEGRLFVRALINEGDELVGNSLWFKRGIKPVVQHVRGKVVAPSSPPPAK